MKKQCTDNAVPQPFPIYDVRTLTGEEGRAGLELDGVMYSLRITQTGKLILTK
ncbi:MAG: hemin uptake protein HemP [Roseobacter sp.]